MLLILFFIVKASGQMARKVLVKSEI